jgi:hypothetical protein
MTGQEAKLLAFRKDKCKKTIANLQESYGNEVFSSCSEQDINEMKG